LCSILELTSRTSFKCTQVYEERRRDSLKLMHDTEARRSQIEELVRLCAQLLLMLLLLLCGKAMSVAKCVHAELLLAARWACCACKRALLGLA